MLVDISAKGLEVKNPTIDEGRAIVSVFGGRLDRNTRSIFLEPRAALSLTHFYKAETTGRFQAWLKRETSRERIEQRLSPFMSNHQRRDMIRLIAEKRLGLWWGGGAGKTVMPLEYAKLFGRTLVLATALLVEDAYKPDLQKWYKGIIKVVDTTGCSPEERKALLRSEGDLFVVSPHVLGKAYEEILDHPWSGIFIDESSDYRNLSSAMTKALLTLADAAPVKVCMSADPAPKGQDNLWPQISFMTGKGGNPGILGSVRDYKRNLRENAEAELAKVAKVSSYVGYDEYWPDRPQKHVHAIGVNLGDKQMAKYKEMESNYRVRFSRNGGKLNEVVVRTRTTQLMKLREITSGFVYDDRGRALLCGTAKLEALYSLLRTKCLGQVSVWCCFSEEYSMVASALDRWRISHSMISGQGKESRLELKKWKAGGSRVLIAHPRTAGHGFRFENSPCGIYMSLDYDPDSWRQSMLRHYRPPQTEDCHFYNLLAPGTIDIRIWEVLQGSAEWHDIYTRTLSNVA